MKTKKTHIQQRRTLFHNNQQQIMILCKIEEQDYLELKFETAMQFLEQLFPQYNSLVQRHATSSFYWKWWRSEWSLWEDQLLRDLPQIDAQEYYQELGFLIHDGMVENSFRNNYLKFTKAK